MTQYCTLSNLSERFGQDELTQRSDRSGTGVRDDAVLAQAIADASAEIDAYLARRYELPLAEVPPVLTRVACDLARFALYPDQATDEVQARAEHARRLLRDLTDGRISLGLPAATAQPTPSLSAANAGAARVFGRSGTSGY